MQYKSPWDCARKTWIDPPPSYQPLGAYTSLMFPIRKGCGEPPGLVVLDEIWSSWRDPGKLLKIAVFRPGDDPSHVFLDAAEWRLFPNRRRLAEMYNAPFRASQRLAMVRYSAPNKGLETIIDNYDLAWACRHLQRLIERDPDDEATVEIGSHFLDWSPSGQVWKNGERWVLIGKPRSH